VFPQIVAEVDGLIFKQDGARAQFVPLYTVLWITISWSIDPQGRPINWPSQSPDVTPIDFFFWRYIKDTV
jgi:hypothetical protein